MTTSCALVLQMQASPRTVRETMPLSRLQTVQSIPFETRVNGPAGAHDVIQKMRRNCTTTPRDFILREAEAGRAAERCSGAEICMIKG